METEIINELKGENNQAFGQLYKAYFGMVQRFVIKNSGRTEDAEDIFQDTLLVLVEKLKQDDFYLTASIKTYIMAIAKNLWFKHLRTAYREVEFSEQHDRQFFEDINQAIEDEKTYWNKLQNYLEQITTHCQHLIRKMFFQSESIEQIQKEYGYSSKHNAQNQKHKCVEQIRRVKQEDERKDKKNRLLG